MEKGYVIYVYFRNLIIWYFKYYKCIFNGKIIFFKILNKCYRCKDNFWINEIFIIFKLFFIEKLIENVFV